ncbi:MAG: helix-turn-helix domain-containing protein [Clostridiales bacterium]|mgnify:FL=1|nr:helix-turn-helix domain-containing protein [Clostridiales bacterium]HOA84905.1 S24 family peptidase [Bacillota bacterium]
MDYLARIKAEKSRKKITNEQLSEMTGIPLSTLSKMLAGFSESPKLSNIVAICEALDCSLDYIVNGIPENTNNYTLEPDEIRFIEEYRKLDRHGREVVRAVLDKELERLTVEEYKNAASPRAKILPMRKVSSPVAMQDGAEYAKRAILLYNLPVSAGPGEYLEDSAAEEITIPDNAKTKDADFALCISGDSMEPKYSDGDIVLVQRCDEVQVGEPAIYLLDGAGYFKIFGGDRLISLNPEYGDILLKNFTEVRCSGRVIGKLRRKK